MPANGRWDLIRRLKVNCINVREPVIHSRALLEVNVERFIPLSGT